MFSKQAINLITVSLLLGFATGSLLPVFAEEFDFIGINDTFVPDSISGKLSMSDAIKMAIVNNPKVVIERANIEEKIWSVDESKSYLYPQIYVKQDFIASNNPVQAFMMRLGQRNFNIGTANLNYPGSEANFSTRIGAKLTLIDRKIYSDIDIKKAELELQKQIGKAAIFDLVKEVRKAFLDVQFAKERVGNAQSNLDAANEHFKAVTSKKEVGMASKSDFLGAKVSLSNAKEGLVKSKNDLNLAWITFADLLGDDNVVGQDLDDRMNSDYTVDSVDKLVKYSFLHRPEIAEVELSKDKSLKNLKLAKRTGSMTLDVLGEWGVDTILDDKNIARSYTAAVFLNKPLFDGGLRRSKIRKAQAGIDKSDARIDQVYRQIKLEVVQSYLSFVNSKERLTMTNDLVADAEESFRAYTERFSVGLSNSVEVENAQAKLSDARLLRAHALYDLKFAVISLQRAMGMSIEDILLYKGLLIQDQVKLEPPVPLEEKPVKINDNDMKEIELPSPVKEEIQPSSSLKVFPGSSSSGSSFLNKSDSRIKLAPSVDLNDGKPGIKETSGNVIDKKSEVQEEHSFLDDTEVYDTNDNDVEIIEVEEIIPVEEENNNIKPEIQDEHSFLDSHISEPEDDVNTGTNEIIEITPDLRMIRVKNKDEN